MSTLSSLKSRLSIELADSEIVNKNDPQRTQAINEALRQTFEYRNWPNLYLNKDIQGVDGILKIPKNMDKPVIIWYGQNTDFYWEYNFINQTDYLTKYPYSITVTEYNGHQVLKFSDDQNKGHAVSNYVANSIIGINDIAGHEQVGQTFVATDSILYGSLLKLNTVGSPEGTLTVDIKATVGGLPTGASLATSTIEIDELNSYSEYLWSKFVNSVELVEGDIYSITITPSYATDPANYVQWAYSTTSQITGSQVLFDGGIWSLGAGDQAFAICNNFFKFQYTTKFIDLSSSTDDSGMPQEFDQAIAKMAAGIMWETKGIYDKANIKFYGIGGSSLAPTMNSAFGLLNTLWNRAFEAIRTPRRIKTIYQGRNYSNRRYDNYYNPIV